MFLRVEQRVQSIAGRGKRKQWEVMVFRCDHPACLREFEKTGTGKANAAYSEREFHFCSIACVNAAQARGGILEQKRKADCLERLGVDHPMKTDEGKANFNAAMIAEYGVPWSFMSDEILTTREDNWEEKTGYRHFMQDPEVQQKSKETNLAVRGVEYPTQDPTVIAKSKQTCLSKYGVDNVFKSDYFRELMDENIDEIVKKRHETMKKNGTYSKSQPEDRCYLLLATLFGDDDVERQVTPAGTRWPIDLFVKSKQIYIQVDGEYWHGLDRPLQQIQSLKNERDPGILRTMETDRKQNIWFSSQDKILLRVTDQEVTACENSTALLSLLEKKLNDRQNLSEDDT